MSEKALTAFGSACREIRMARKLRMIDQAKEFNCSPSFISAVETGVKQVPEGYVEKFGNWLNLDLITKKHLQALADARINVIRFTPINKERAALARRLFRKINKMSPDEIRKLDTDLPGDER
ncbi:helix-turn-helix transcriptional regulator [Mesorhizobium sp. B2-2-4]|uniref:helix-turn-helix domain-containing protein n=1 Tax=unclassified Mesorhizobium TaxID=325217 RepID=UPI001126B2AF|nr:MULTISPECIES: helix-turn-helix transcriptional regulator [unclassified Mesorhizobium]TPM54377.1 helix-turn-helix transcriptional regulator [Mesorhizobium sp. B2-2-4]TPM64411.1 helix-turn-helix transcriptional regulator [Mesorhizobium sp. B2-2-1]TPN69441.1 helix-turn-helix transcriptional regulator [Mesorhizobium sp. B1-1-3]